MTNMESPSPPQQQQQQQIQKIHIPPSPQTLEQLLSDTDSNLFQHFQLYLEQSFCSENLYFWLDVQEYNDLCGQLEHDGKDFQFLQHQSGSLLSSAHQLIFHVVQQKCHAMIDTYIRPNSNQEINIPCELRDELLDQVFVSGNYHPRIFTRITKSVMELMRVNAFIPWVSSLMDTSTSNPLSRCLSSTSAFTANNQQQQSTVSNPTSPTTLSFSFVMDRWYSFNKPKPLARTDSMDSTNSLDAMDSATHKHNTDLDMSTASPPPSPTTSSSPPASARYRSVLQRVKHSFMPSPSNIKPSMSLKRFQQQQQQQ
ncbi:RGS domain-containing protein [Absidia repens]|uniref:RGS domain-containing protein n=1 Tax=Absidia repens TaxID=90262 RepID=A0A1X2IZ01_9FUNG|nr:RGS domain-containing protein [Absidia repens]